MRRPAFPILAFGGCAAAALFLVVAFPLRSKFGDRAIAAAGAGYGLAVAVGLLVFAAELRAAARGVRTLRGVAAGFLAKLVLLGGGILLGRLSGYFDGVAYGVGFMAGTAVAGAAGVLQVQRTFPPRGARAS